MTAHDNAIGDVRDTIVAACRHLAERGLSPGSSGNVSVRLDDRLLITPTGTSLSRVGPAELTEGLPVAPYAPPGTAALAAGVAQLAAWHAVLLPANHGPVVAARTVVGAADLAEELETAARVYFLLVDRPHRTLTDQPAAALRVGAG